MWSPVAWTTVGEAGLDQRTPDLSSIVDEIVKRPGWSQGNSMGFLITGTGKRVAVAYDGDRYGAPLLHVEYGAECPNNNPVPATTSLSPAFVTAGGSAFTLTVNGSGFVDNSVVRWNGADRTTTRVSSTQLAAAIGSSDIAVAGTAQVTVFNPAPGGGTSNAQTFTINNPVPTTMHIGDLDGTSKPDGSRWWNATVTIMVHDDSHKPVQNATVSGSWTGGISSTGSCTTGISGSCSITSYRIKSSKRTVTFTVAKVTHGTLYYNSTPNHDPDADSNGMVIVVSK